MIFRNAFVLLVVSLLLTSSTLYAEDKCTLSGYVKNAKSGEEIIGAVVSVKAPAMELPVTLMVFTHLLCPKESTRFCIRLLVLKRLNAKWI